MIHDLKSWPHFFLAVWTGEKTWEVRRADRHFEKGDLIRLREWAPASLEYTGRELLLEIVYITDIDPFIGADFVGMTVRRI